MVSPQFVDHIVFRVSNLGETERFYTTLLGEPPHQTNDSIMYRVGDTRVFFTPCDLPQAALYQKEAVGLNHLAFGVRTPEELQLIQTRLKHKEIANSGIRKDQYGNKDFIWLDDPDGMRVEFYLRPL